MTKREALHKCLSSYVSEQVRGQLFQEIKAIITQPEPGLPEAAKRYAKNHTVGLNPKNEDEAEIDFHAGGIWVINNILE